MLYNTIYIALNNNYMREYKVLYQDINNVHRFTYVDANSIEEARALVYNNKLNCVQTLSAECVSN